MIDPSGIRDLLELGLSGALMAALLLFIYAKVIPSPTHREIVENRDKQIEELKEEKNRLNEAVREITKEQIQAITDIVQTQKDTMLEQRQTIDLLLELRRSEGAKTHE